MLKYVDIHRIIITVVKSLFCKLLYQRHSGQNEQNKNAETEEINESMHYYDDDVETKPVEIFDTKTFLFRTCEIEHCEN